MEPKEKAKDLFDKMYWHFRTIADLDICKQCALIAVDELIYETQFEVPNIRQRYWIDVKQEIEKL
jgi:hypothetical protein